MICRGSGALRCDGYMLDPLGVESSRAMSTN
jgi:hypothetical protein